MDESPKPPSTPPKQIVRSASSSSLSTPDIDLLSSSQQEEVNQHRLKIEELTSEGPPKLVEDYLKWMLAVKEAEIQGGIAYRRSLHQQRKDGAITLEQLVEALELFDNDYERVLREHIFLVEQFRHVDQDLRDTVKTAESAYLDDLYRSYVATNTAVPKARTPRMARNQFKDELLKYYGAEQMPSETVRGEKMIWCSVTGRPWSAHNMCAAHIIPYSFDKKNLGYLFGTGDAALSSARNGILMLKTVEEAWDRGDFDIVPDGSVEQTPTEWKVVLLKPGLEKFPFKNTDPDESGQIKQLYWRELDGKRLTFLNDSRPARRYLYFRHVMAMMNAETMNWAGYRDRVPPTDIWASPQKPGDYLRRSVLRNMGRHIGDNDQFMAEFEPGTFEDPQSQDPQKDQTTCLALILARLNHDGTREQEYDSEDSDVD